MLTLGLVAPSTDLSARVFGQDDRKHLSADHDPLSRSAVVLMPTRRNGEVVTRRYVTGVFTGDCQTIVTVAHLRSLAPNWVEGEFGAAVFFRDRRGVWLRRTVAPDAIPRRAGRPGPESDFMVLRLAAALKDCAPLTFGRPATAQGSTLCDRPALLSMQVPVGRAHAVPTLSERCGVSPWRGGASLIAHDCDLSVGASGGALICLGDPQPTAFGLQVARVFASADSAAAAPASLARTAPNVALRYDSDAFLRAIRATGPAGQIGER
ncbi:MAG: hypothetical protein AAFW46_15085 [Pseudomonadota bacterium]